MNNMHPEMPVQLLAVFNDAQIADITSFILANREQTIPVVRGYKNSGYAQPAFLGAVSDRYASPDDARRMLIGLATLLASCARDVDLDFSRILDIAKKGTNLPSEIIDFVANKYKSELEFAGGMMSAPKTSGGSSTQSGSTQSGSTGYGRGHQTDEGDTEEVGNPLVATVGSTAASAASFAARGSRMFRFGQWIGQSKMFQALRRNKKWVKRGALAGLVGYTAFNTVTDMFSSDDEEEAAAWANTVNWAFAAKLVALGRIIEEIMEKSRLLPASLEFAFPAMSDAYIYEGGDPASVAARDGAVYEAMRQAIPMPFDASEAGIFADAVERGDAIRQTCFEFASKLDRSI